MGYLKPTRASLVVLTTLLAVTSQTYGQMGVRRPAGLNRPKGFDKPAILKDTFYEDHSYVVRIRTSYNHTSSITCNGVVMEDQLVLSDVTCIKYQGMANIDAKFVRVIAGEANNESEYEVDQIYINKADKGDSSTELALLKLSRPLKVETQCRTLLRPERNHSIEFETPVRVVGYTNNFELKENRSRVAKKIHNTRFICTTPAEINETPGSHLLRGAPLLQMVDCRQYQLVGILTKTEPLNEPGIKRHQDCYVSVSTQIKWYEQVKSLAPLAAKSDGNSTQPSVIVVSVDEDPIVTP